ncbi:MAG: hypothetical protein IJ121_10405 [Eubacterium sp.]|nr:hypothetical protein [Eubacterium sp.]
MRVLFYGDSNTYGFDPRDPFDDRYPASVRWTDRLAAMLNNTADAASADDGSENAGFVNAPAGRDKWEVIARGQNGRCVPVMPQMTGYIRSMIMEVWPVDRFAVMLGTNDLLQTHHPDAALPAAQMRQFLLYLQKEFPEMERMLIAPPVLFEGLGDGVFFRRSREESLKLTRMYERIAKETGAMFINAGKWEIDLAADYVHFSETGHAQFAEQIKKYFLV